MSVVAFLAFCSLLSQDIVVVFGSLLLSFPTGAAETAETAETAEK